LCRVNTLWHAVRMSVTSLHPPRGAIEVNYAPYSCWASR
jgi:hypothetical protein